MSNYTKATNFAVKDGLPSGNPAKLIKGTEIDTEFTAIQTAIATKADEASPSLSGTVTLASGTTISTNGVTVSDVELGYVDGVTSNIQSQLNAKATIGNVPVDTHAATSKTTPVDADEIPLADSGASFGLKKLTWASLKATLKTYFDTLYASLSGAAFTGDVGVGMASAAGNRLAIKGQDSTSAYNALLCKNSSDTALFRVQNDGAVLAVAPVGMGYGTGAGGTVTQSTSKSTAVTLNKPCGQITMNSAALAANTGVGFIVYNSLVSSTDTAVVHVEGGTTSTFQYEVSVKTFSAGQFYIYLRNTTAGSLSEAIIITYAIIKGATS